MPDDQTPDDNALAVIDRHFRAKVEVVPMLRRRAEDEGVTGIGSAEDLLSVLFPHSLYKSYPPQLIEQGRWDQMNRWLDSLSAARITSDVTNVEDVDGWIARLAADGHHVVASSGTTGKSSFLNKSTADLEAARDAQVEALAERGVLPDRSWTFVSVGGKARVATGSFMSRTFTERFARSDGIAPPPADAPTEGHISFLTRLVGLRRAMAEGTATPGQLADLEREQQRRHDATTRNLTYWADAILERPGDTFLFGAMMANAWRLVEVLGERGAKPGDLTGANALYMAGGTKGVTLPPDAEEQTLAMLNVAPEQFVQMYGMQETNRRSPRCSAGRYHPQAGLHLLVLDEPGEALAPVVDGVAVGRAAFVDETADNRWGGIITGDRIEVAYRGCPCGRAGPAVLPSISRYGTGGDDKITCAGTMDAYVRGVIDV